MNILEKIVEQKKIEIEKMPLILDLEKSEKDFKWVLRNRRDNSWIASTNWNNSWIISTESEIKLIAEIKKASPSNPSIFTKEFDPVKIAKDYEKSWADCISILTDKEFFKWDFEYLEKIAKAVKIPCLCKDFIISEKQIYFARSKWADAILLISAILTVEKMQEFLNLARQLWMDAICEVHNEEELEKVLKTDWEIIWINNRNLKTFEIDLQTTLDLADKIRKKFILDSGSSPEWQFGWKIIISESWIYDFWDIKKISTCHSHDNLCHSREGGNPGKRQSISWILVWTSIMQAKSMKLKIKELKWKTFFKACWIREKLNSYKWIDLLWFNFVKTSKRKISIEKALEIICHSRIHLCHSREGGNPENNNLEFPNTVALFQNQPLKQILEIWKKINFDFIQLHWEEDLDFCKKIKNEWFWVIKAFKIDENFEGKIKPFLEKRWNYSSENIIDYFIFDSWNWWTWENFNPEFLKWIKIPYILAGWVSEKNVLQLLKNHSFAIWIDTASWVENDEKTNISEKKILEIIEKIN